MDTGHTLDSVRVGEEPFGSLLRTYRERAGLTQEQLAERAGISANAVSALERGTRRRPYPHTRDALAAALGLTAAERATWEGGHTPRGPLLPASLTSILGRDAEILEVVRLLSSERMVTLVGPGGVGKTRVALAVALAVAEQAARHYPSGVVFVPLAGLGEAGDVLPAIANALSVRELGPRALPEALAAYLRARRVLLVLDNVEHLLDAAPAVAALAASAPRLTVLATSRAPLRIRGEHLHPVPALDPQVAAALFAERAGQATGLPLEADPSLVARLCARLDHLPLAIELAAVRTRLLAPPELLDRLDTLPSVDGPRDAPRRQRTLRDTVLWSYDLLPEAAQALLRRLAVFSGGWTLAAATSLAAVRDSRSVIENTVLELHRALLDNSLITRTGARFSMLETVRAVALEQLTAAGEDSLTRNRHAAFFGDLAGGSEARLWGEGGVAALDELQAEHENLRTALRYLRDQGRVQELATACFGSWLFWVVRGHLREPLALADAALAAHPDMAAGDRAKLQFVAGMTLLPRGNYADAVRRFDEAAALGTPRTRCWALVCWAHAEVYRGQAARAAELLREAAETEDLPGTEHARSCAVIGEAHVAIATGAMRTADELLTARLPAIEGRHTAWPLAVALGVQGRVASVLGEEARADRLLTRSVEIFGELEDTWGMAHQLTHVAGQGGDHARAALLYGAVDVLADQVGARVFPVWQKLSDRCQADALVALGVERYAELRRQGRGLAVAEVVELAVGGPLCR